MILTGGGGSWVRKRLFQAWECGRVSSSCSSQGYRRSASGRCLVVHWEGAQNGERAPDVLGHVGWGPDVEVRGD
jgi:hypothetical protein